MNRMPRPVVASLIVLFVGVLPCMRAGAVDPTAEAKRQFQEAEAHYDAGRWTEAVAGYQQAYVLSPRPPLLFNIAQAYRNLGDVAGAIGYYRQYLEKDPKGKRVAEARKHLASLEASLPKQPPVEPVMQPEIVKEPAPRPPEVTSPPIDPVIVKPAEAVSPPPKQRPVWPYAIGAVLVVGGSVGLGLGFGLAPKDGPLNPDYETVKVDF